VNNFICITLNTILIGSYHRDIFNKIAIKFVENKITVTMSRESEINGNIIKKSSLRDLLFLNVLYNDF